MYCFVTYLYTYVIKNVMEQIFYELNIASLMEGISRLDLPARKMFVNDLQNAVHLYSMDSSITDLKYWKTESNGDMSFSTIWVQGNVSASGVGVVAQSCSIILG